MENHDHMHHHQPEAEHQAPVQVSEAVDSHSAHTAHAAHDPAHAAHDSAHAAHSPAHFKKQFWLAAALTLPTLIFSSTWQGWFHANLAFPGSIFIPAVFGTAVLATGGRVFLKAGLAEIGAKRPGMMALISMALIVALGYSLFLLIAQLASLGFSGMDFWWELSTLVSIMLLGHWLEMSSVQKAQNSVGELAELIPDFAEVVADGVVTKIAVKRLQVGDIVLVRAGSSVPADGVIVDGQTKLNESMLTGESKPVHKVIGDSVIAGTVNAAANKPAEQVSVADLLAAADMTELGAIKVQVTAVGSDSVISGIMKLVADAQASKSKTQLLADKAAGWLFYAALSIAALTALIWSIPGAQTPSFVLERVVTVLVIACPHALGLAVPLVTAITTDNAARNGILIRNRLAFEAARNVDVVLFDKTGTLTTGQRGFTGVKTTRRGGLESEDELISVVAGLEVGSEHSIAKAILAEAEARGIEPVEVKDVMTIPGVGVSGRFQEFRLYAGGPALLTRQKIDIDVQDLFAADAMNSEGKTVVYVVRDDVLLGFVSVGDVTRETSADAVWELQALGKKVGMLTGDAHGVANALAKELKIDEVYAEVLPQHKAELVQGLQAKGRTVAMVGDGINDAPALAQADIGLAIGSGTNVAVESADIVLVSDDPEAVARALQLSRKSYAKMVQNLWWAAGYNVIAIPLAAGLFEPIGLVLNPAVGAVLMSLSTIIVALNAQKLRSK